MVEANEFEPRLCNTATFYLEKQNKKTANSCGFANILQKYYGLLKGGEGLEKGNRRKKENES
jgi:hypothetical protein